jgi:hypothetical protein
MMLACLFVAVAVAFVVTACMAFGGFADALVRWTDWRQRRRRARASVSRDDDTPSRLEPQAILAFYASEAARAAARIGKPLARSAPASDAAIQGLLARAEGEDDATWRGRVASYIGSPTYRGTHVRVEALLDVARDPAAIPSARVAASRLLLGMEGLTSAQRGALALVIAVACGEGGDQSEARGDRARGPAA